MTIRRRSRRTQVVCGTIEQSTHMFTLRSTINNIEKKICMPTFTKNMINRLNSI